MPKEVPAPVVRGGYGTIFYDGKTKTSETYGQQKEPNLARIEQELYIQSVRDSIPPPHPAEWDTYVQQRGNLLKQSTESPAVVNSLLANEYAKANPVFLGALGPHGEQDQLEARSGLAKYFNRRRVKDDSDSFEEKDGAAGAGASETPGYMEATRQSVAAQYKPPDALLKNSSSSSSSNNNNKESWGVGKSMSSMRAVHLGDREAGEAFHVPLQQDPYTDPLLAQKHPSDSAHLTSTPKMWPVDKQYPTSSARQAAEAAIRLGTGLTGKGKGTGPQIQSRSVEEPLHLYNRPRIGGTGAGGASDEASLASSLDDGSWASGDRHPSHSNSHSHSLSLSLSQSRSNAIGSASASAPGVCSKAVDPATAAATRHKAPVSRHSGHAGFGGGDDDEGSLGDVSLTSSITGPPLVRAMTKQTAAAAAAAAANSHPHSHSLSQQGSEFGQSRSHANTNASALQMALMTCGRLHTDDAKSHEQRGKMQQALESERRRVKKHGLWLQNNASRPAPKPAQPEDQGAVTGSSHSVSSWQQQSKYSDGSGRANPHDDLSLDSLYTSPYQSSFAAMTHSQRVAALQQAELARSTEAATKALGSYKESKGKGKKHKGQDGDGLPDDDDDDPYAKPAWRDKKRRQLQAAPANKGDDDEGDYDSVGGSKSKGKGKGKMPLHPSLGAPLSPSQLVDLHGDEHSLASSHYSRENYKRYGQELSEHLDAVTATSGATGGLAGAASLPRNPFRPSRHREMQVSNRAKPLNPLDPLDYKPSMRVIRPAPGSGLTIVLRPDKTLHHAVPTEDEVHDALARVSRRSVLAYDTRIVETGTLVKALQQPAALDAPGLAAVFELHAAFVTAAALNPNPWQLKREQLQVVILNKLHWLDPLVVRRLVSAYDPTASGVIRYVRLSAALVCCMNPGLAVLITTLERLGEEREAKAQVQRDRNAMRKRLMHGNGHDASKSTSTSTSIGAGTGAGTGTKGGDARDGRTPLQRQHENELKCEADREHATELFLLKLIHTLYEDCEGGVAAAATSAAGGVFDNSLQPTQRLGLTNPDGLGLRLEDLLEAVSCCAACVEDELSMAAAMRPVLQQLYRQGQAKDDVIAAQLPPADEDGEGDSAAAAHFGGGSRHGRAGVWMQSDDAASVGSASLGGSMSSNFTALSRFTPKSKADAHPSTSDSAKAAVNASAGGSASAIASGRVGATAQDRDRQDQKAQRAAERWRQARGIGRDGVSLGRGAGSLSAPLSAHQRDLGGESGSLRWGADSLAWASDRDDHSVGSFSTLPSVSVLGGPNKPSRSRSRGVTTFDGSGPSQSASVSVGASQSKTKRLHPVSVLQHLSLKSSQQIPRVSQDELAQAFLRHPAALKEFVRQLTRFRNLCFPNAMHGSVTYSEAKQNPSVPYGKQNL